MKETFEFEFKSHRCWDCGTFFAVESARDTDVCPRCAFKELNAKANIIRQQERTIAGLRGALSKRRKKT